MGNEPDDILARAVLFVLAGVFIFALIVMFYSLSENPAKGPHLDPGAGMVPMRPTGR